MKISSNNSNQWNSATQNKSKLMNSGSNKSLFKTLNNSYHLSSYFKNGLMQTSQVKANNGVPESGLSVLKRKVLDLKCKLSGLQGERAKKAELETKLDQLQQKKQKEEAKNRAEIEELMRSLSSLKGDLEEQKTRLQRAELKKEIKSQDLKKMEELVSAKEEELEELQAKRVGESKKMNDLLAEKDSLEKEAFLLKEEANRLDLESARLARLLREAQARQKVALEQTERIQVLSC